MSSYTMTVRTTAEPQEAEKAVREALADEGFGILTEIDVQATLKQKIDVDMPPYKILGACNPPLAHKGIQADYDVGALLPCNVVVRAHADGGSEIVAADPIAMLAVSDAPGLSDLADDARSRIARALEAVAS